MSAHPNQPDQGHVWLLRARAALAGHQSITAKIHQRVHLYGQELVASGILVQGAPTKNLLCLDLTLKIDGQDSYTQQRSDGRDYWLQKFEDGIPKLMRIDLKRVESAARAAHAPIHLANPAATGGTVGVPLLGMGGMANLLDQLAEWCVFPKVIEGHRLPTRERTPVIVLEGTWQRERLLHWLPDQANAAPDAKVDLRKLPPELPDRIVVFLGRDDLFPRRIEYSLGESREASDDDPEPLVQVHFDEVHFDRPVDPRQFKFEGGVVPPVDLTDYYLLRAGLLHPVAR
ncbi:MAG TPA: hypothetical protein VHC22_29170 [Pirellulales bacterium]|nr:hypothetical protein [Pirellulales bacterium]